MSLKPVAIVTGAARNIGLAVARRLAEDYTVVLADMVDASRQASEIGQGARAVVFDVGNADSCRELVSAALALGELVTVVHGAAVTAPAVAIEEIDPAVWRRLIDVNLSGTFYLMQACIPALRESAREVDHRAYDANVVLITSRAAKTGFAALSGSGGPTKAHYCASKAGVISLTRSMAVELAAEGIRVNGVAPGPIEGDMIPSESWPEIIQRVPLKRLGTPADIANAVYFLVRPSAGFITGHVLDVNGGTLMD